MGLLDAVVVPEHFKEKVLEYREGMRDTYLFTSSHRIQKNITDFLEVSMERDDIIFYQEFASILESISTVEGVAGTKDHMFWQGMLHGTISGTYQAKYIGVKAREAYKQEQILRFRELISREQEQIALLQKELDELEQRKKTLEREFEQLPKEDDVKIAVAELKKVEKELESKEREIEVLKQDINVILEQLTKIRVEAAGICRKVYLKSDLAVFFSAKEELDEYKVELLKVEHMHKEYLHHLELCQTYENQLENIRMDMDELRYDLGRFERQKNQNLLEITKYEEQLKLEDYEAVKAKLEYCVERLRRIPTEQTECSKQQGLLEGTISNLQKQKEELEEKKIKLKERYQLAQRGFEDEDALNYVEDTRKTNEETSIQKARRLIKILWQENDKSSLDMAGVLQERYHKYKGEMAEFGLYLKYLFTKDEYEEYCHGMDPGLKRLDILGKYKGKEVAFPVLVQGISEDVEIQKNLVKESDRTLFEDILAHTISKKIRLKIYNSEKWVDNMNALMSSMNTSSGLKLNLVWKKKKAEEEGQLDTGRLVELLKKDAGIMREEEINQLSSHFQSKVEEARRRMEDVGNTKSFHGIMKEVLDYRKWFEFQLFFEKTGERKKELTNNAFFTFSGGEKAMSMYVPLFSAVVAKYQGARPDAPRLISLDEAFAGVDDTNIRDMFRLMVEFEFEFVINSQILWGDCDTVPSLAIYQLLRPENAKYVTVLPYKWNGKVRKLMVKEGEEENKS